MERDELRIAIYARVSTKNAQDPEMQLAELREYIRNRQWKIAGEYVDKGISGASDSRSELNRLMADANRRRFDVVAVWKFDRFARSVSPSIPGSPVWREHFRRFHLRKTPLQADPHSTRGLEPPARCQQCAAWKASLSARFSFYASTCRFPSI